MDRHRPTPNPSRKREGDDDAADETRAVAGWVLDQILVLLHPFMPFVTEELWSKLGAREYELIVAKWPVVDAVTIDADAKGMVNFAIALISEIRSAKTDLGIPPSNKTAAYFNSVVQDMAVAFPQLPTLLERLGRLTPYFEAADASGKSVEIGVGEATVLIPLEGIIDLDAERARLTKAIEAAAKERDSLAARLNNPAFAEKAKPEAVEKARADHTEKAAEAERLSAALARLG